MNNPNKILKADPKRIFNRTFGLKNNAVFIFENFDYKIVDLIDKYENEDTLECNIEFVCNSVEYPYLFYKFCIYKGVYNDGLQYFYDCSPYLVKGKLITVWERINE
jgi:hypothetical protein